MAAEEPAPPRPRRSPVNLLVRYPRATTWLGGCASAAATLRWLGP